MVRHGHLKKSFLHSCLYFSVRNMQDFHLRWSIFTLWCGPRTPRALKASVLLWFDCFLLSIKDMIQMFRWGPALLSHLDKASFKTFIILLTVCLYAAYS